MHGNGAAVGLEQATVLDHASDIRKSELFNDMTRNAVVGICRHARLSRLSDVPCIVQHLAQCSIVDPFPSVDWMRKTIEYDGGIRRGKEHLPQHRVFTPRLSINQPRIKDQPAVLNERIEVIARCLPFCALASKRFRRHLPSLILRVVVQIIKTITTQELMTGKGQDVLLIARIETEIAAIPASSAYSLGQSASWQKTDIGWDLDVKGHDE